MKRISLIVLAIIFLPVMLRGQDNDWHFETGLAFSPYDAELWGKDQIIMSKHAIFLPTLCFGALRPLPGDYFQLYLGGYLNYALCNQTGGIGVMKERKFSFHLVPEIRFLYIDDGKSKLWSGIGAGLRYRIYQETYAGSTISKHNAFFSYTIVPLGASFVNKKVSMELGLGRAWSVLKVAYMFN